MPVVPKHQTGDTVLVAMKINGKCVLGNSVEYTVQPKSGQRSIVVLEGDIIENHTTKAVVRPVKSRIVRPD